ncbi:MAG: ABC transporter ATP-binding protein [Thermoplasmata archaeon]|nr:ABC transporter ATP-binding protein [Thermoplasmata archaeon]
MAGHRGPGSLAGVREKRSRSMRVLLRAMFKHLGKFKRIIAIAAVLSVLASIFMAVDPLVLSWGVDLVLDPSSAFSAILLLCVLYLVLKLTSWILGSLNTWILSGAQAGFVQSLQQSVYDKLLRADLSYHKAQKSGDVTSRVISDTDSLSAGIQIIIDLSSQILLLVATFILMWLTSPLVALTALLVVPVVLLIVVLFGTVGQRIMLATQRAIGIVSGQIAESLSGVHIAKAFNRESETAATLSKLNQEAYRHGFKFMMLMTLMQPLVRATGIAAMSAVLFVGGGLAVGAASTLTLGQVFLGTILIQRFFMPLLSLSMNATQFQASLASMDRLMDVLETEPTVRDALDAVPLSENSDGVVFRNVSFSYLEGSEVLRNINFTIAPGETVAVVGHTGAGKTTIAALINRFYDPQSGQILIGNQDMKSITRESLHNTVSLIAQEPYLFNGTVMENIRYGKPSATDEEIKTLSRLMGADEYIEVLPQGYDTLLFEEGKNLSAGQIQMISIARTMLANPRILILDEATSRLDAYSESLVQSAQEKLFAGRTTVVIAHRLTTIANASRILVFEHGKLLEHGTHTELLAKGGRYKVLYDTYYHHQTAGEITEEAVARARDELRKIGSQASV